MRVRYGAVDWSNDLAVAARMDLDGPYCVASDRFRRRGNRVAGWRTEGLVHQSVRANEGARLVPPQVLSAQARVVVSWARFMLRPDPVGELGEQGGGEETLRILFRRSAMTRPAAEGGGTPAFPSRSGRGQGRR